jgi:hypothetical protein
MPTTPSQQEPECAEEAMDMDTDALKILGMGFKFSEEVLLTFIVCFVRSSPKTKK